MLLQLFPELSFITLAALGIHTKNTKYTQLLAGGVLTVFFGVLLKKVSSRLVSIFPRDILYRPSDAVACNMMQTGKCGNEMGMPSIHSMVAGFYAGKLYKKHTYAALALVVVPLSRLSRRDSPLINHGEHGCHTVLQICIGFTIGLALSKAL